MRFSQVLNLVSFIQIRAVALKYVQCRNVAEVAELITQHKCRGTWHKLGGTTATARLKKKPAPTTLENDLAPARGATLDFRAVSSQSQFFLFFCSLKFRKSNSVFLRQMETTVYFVRFFLIAISPAYLCLSANQNQF